MDKKIEELKETLRRRCVEGEVASCVDADCYLCEAEYLYEAGYRKIPEGAVVVTREEYYAERKRWEKLAVIKLDEIDKTVKETAEKFAKESKQRLKDKLHRGKALHTTVFGKEYVRRIFKEVIDEICKEITEDKV